MTLPRIGPARVPALGLGTYRLTGAEATRIVAAALAEGYRHIDTAQAYGNEAEVGAALAAASTPRDEVFLVSKIMPERFAPSDFRRAAEESLRRLGTDYLDLLLLHWPSRAVPVAETMGAMNALIRDGLVRHGGVSNFTVAQVEEARAALDAPLAANQVEFHPFIDQARLLAHLERVGVPFAAYSPLARGKVLDEPVLREVGAAHGVGPVEATLAWILSKPNAIAIPKTASSERLAANLRAATLRLGEDEIARIDALASPEGRLVSPEGLAPDWD